MKSILLVLLAIFFQLQSVNAQDMMAVTEQQQDYLQAVKELKKRDLGLYLFIDQPDFDQFVDSLYKEIKTEQTTIEFYRFISQLLVPIEERHLSLVSFQKKSSTGEFLNSEKLLVFPMLPYFESDTSTYVIRNAFDEDSLMQLPSKLVSINGQPIDSVRNQIAKYVTADHGSTTWKDFEITNSFPSFYYTYVDTTSQFTVEWLEENGELLKSEWTGIPLKHYSDSIKNQSYRIYGIKQFKPPYRYEMLSDSTVGYIRLATFKKNRIKFEDENYRFKQTTRDFFNQVEDQNINHVIIDLRSNTGGSINLLTYLLAYVQHNREPEKIYYSKRKHRLWWGYAEGYKKTRKQKRPAFDGQLYILTNGGSYSASVMFSTIAKQKADALIAGQQAGGRPNGTSAGRFKIVRLKNSSIKLRIPEAIFDYMIPNEEFNLAPDLPVRKPVSDFFDYEQDTQLEELLNYIKNESPN